MNRIKQASHTLTQLGLALGLVVLTSELPHSAADDWPQFRGRGALGIADEVSVTIENGNTSQLIWCSRAKAS